VNRSLLMPSRATLLSSRFSVMFCSICRIVVSSDQVETDCMQAGSLSSVYRKTRDARLALKYVIGSLGSAVLAGSIIVYADCQPAKQE